MYIYVNIYACTYVHICTYISYIYINYVTSWVLKKREPPNGMFPPCTNQTNV